MPVLHRVQPVPNPVQYLIGSLLVALVTTLAAAAPPSASDLADLNQTLSRQLTPLIAAHRGTVGLAIEHLEQPVRFAHNAERPMPTASLIKLAVMAEAYRQMDTGVLSPDLILTLDEKDKVPGSGILTPHFSPGTRISLKDAIRLMIVYSDNTATNLVLNQIGLEATAKAMRSRGLNTTAIYSFVFRPEHSIHTETTRGFGLGSTTASETVRLLQLLERRQLASEPSCDEMLSHLLACDDKTKLARELPREARLAHKSGAVTRARTDAGILYTRGGPVAICVLTNDNEDRRWDDDQAAHRLCGRIGRIVWDLFDAPSEAGLNSQTLAEGASGDLVEALQRTLNERLNPSPKLSIDGDFGPATATAVRRFQAERQLAVTGRVDALTWESLGELQMDETPVQPPDLVNAEVSEIKAADPLDGPPFVTCRAWILADSGSGQVLASHLPEQPLDIASTTKIMTAYLVLELARKSPTVLDETVTFSRRADRTPGSTSGIKAGEKLPVRELLYGLLLPSGNDASIALAEHFGSRLSPNAGSTDPIERFVAAMNHAAQRLGLQHSTFKNPHGLTEDGHQSTAADLLKLTAAALKVPGFREYIGTRQRGCTVVSQTGYRRNVRWDNTNQLLDIAGYTGVKTGTTSAAGACLVSVARRDGQERILVVLGSSSSAARYVDSRNLFRWGWNSFPEGIIDRKDAPRVPVPSR